MRRLIALPALVFLFLLTAVPAAHAAEGVRFTSPPTPLKGQAVTGTATIEAVAEAPSLLGLLGPTIKTITVTIAPRFEGGPKAVAATQEGSTFKMAWNTGKDAPFNGGYDIEAVATLSNQQTRSARVENVLVNNPPSTPAAPGVGIENGVVAIRWSANPEPDITSYKLSRAVDDGSFTAVASIEAGKALGFTDSEAPVGTSVKYRLVALRRSPVSDAGLSSEPSVSASIAVPVPQPQPVATDAAGNPLPASAEVIDPALAPGTQPLPPAPAASTAPPVSADPFPVRKGAPPPVFKARPSEIAFAEALPFGEAPPPRQFEDPVGGEALAAPSSFTDAIAATNPVKFLIIGTILLLVSFLFARTARRIFKSNPVDDDFLTGADFSSLGEIQLPAAEVAYPAFRAFRN
ncbi:MAG: hypothetical protein ACT4OM_00215 [Actinomycetota bacterium]